MAESLTNYITEVSETVNEKLAETGSTVQAFTKYVLEAMGDMANLGDADECYAIIRNDANNNVMGEINGYAISLSGETICLFGTSHSMKKDPAFAILVNWFLGDSKKGANFRDIANTVAKNTMCLKS